MGTARDWLHPANLEGTITYASSAYHGNAVLHLGSVIVSQSHRLLLRWVPSPSFSPCARGAGGVTRPIPPLGWSQRWLGAGFSPANIPILRLPRYVSIVCIDF